MYTIKRGWLTLALGLLLAAAWAIPAHAAYASDGEERQGPRFEVIGMLYGAALLPGEMRQITVAELSVETGKERGNMACVPSKIEGTGKAAFVIEFSCDGLGPDGTSPVPVFLRVYQTQPDDANQPLMESPVQPKNLKCAGMVTPKAENRVGCGGEAGRARS